MRIPILDLRNRRATRGQHPGLLLQRYLCENATGGGGNPEEKRAILESAIRAAGNPEVRELYKIAFDRWRTSLPGLTAATDLQTVGRLIVGLGTENVLETGIRLHYTYGMPILPGSALKGLAAHYCDYVWGERDNSHPSNGAVQFRGPRTEDRANNRLSEPQGDYHKLLFGATDESGCIVFHDAWFVPDSEKEPLKLDVMTPHHPKWLDGSVPPTDFDSPIPVPFLSVSGKFHVAVSWCGPMDAEERWKWFFARAAQCLRDALFHWGIGGKTTSGYGRFDEEKWKADEGKRQAEAKQKQVAAEKEAALAAMSPIERSIKEFLEQHPDKQAKESIKLLKELEKPNGRYQDPDDRKVVAARIKAAMQRDKEWKDKEPFGKRKKYIQQILGES